MADENLLKLLELVKPESDFTHSNIPKEPNYNFKESWAALPELNGYQYLVPSDAYSVNKNNDIDVFYIHHETLTLLEYLRNFSDLTIVFQKEKRKTY